MPRLTQVSASSLDYFRLRACHALWIHFPEDSASSQIGNSTVADPTTPETPKCYGFGLFRFRSPLLSESRFLSFPSGTEMVHFPEFAHTRLCIHRAVCRFYRHGFPHSEISGSEPVCGYPELIAAYHVLHRLLLPRHPPCALSSLTIKFTHAHVARGRDSHWVPWPLVSSLVGYRLMTSDSSEQISYVLLLRLLHETLSRSSSAAI